MATDKDLLRAAKTSQAPQHGAGPRSEGSMTLEQFMARNPSARSKDRIKDAQTEQGKRRKRGGPKMKETARSRRGGGAVPAPRAEKGRGTDLARRVEESLMDMSIEELFNQ